MRLLKIVAGIIRNEQGEIFITQRVVGANLAGFWEFPGGKVELGETLEEGLKRELFEETSIVVQHAELFQRVESVEQNVGSPVAR